ncbi:hypothetical protein BATDEDRAFT_11206, partial [Batrachochytrium dendrobatidis JAM81]
QAINISHPFGLKIWKPALYPKSRSIDYKSYEALHSVPGSVSSRFLYLSPDNLCWTLLFGWWIALIYVIVAIGILGPICLIGYLGYGVCWVLLNLADYMFWPFGKFIAKKKGYHMVFEQVVDNAATMDSNPIPHPAQEYVGIDINDPLQSSNHGARSVQADGSYYVNGHLEGGELQDLLTEFSLGVGRHDHYSWPSWVPCFVRRTWNAGFSGFTFYVVALLIIAPVHLIVSAICFFFIFPVPMARLTYVLLRHLLRTPLPVRNTARSYSRPHSEYEIVLCTYHSMGFAYYKYTVDGTNIIFINLLFMIAFTLFDFYVIGPSNGYTGIAGHGPIFVFALLSVIPLAYFIGMAVSSITAHTGSVAIGSVINATFGSIIEIILYIIALMEGKNQLVEGSIIGSFLAGLLALPGVAMFSGGLVRKEQRFNAKSAGVTSTMMVVAVIGVFTPTLFQTIYGSVQIYCSDCHVRGSNLAQTIVTMASDSTNSSCRQCSISKVPPSRDHVYLTSTKPLMYFCAIVLVLTYAVGLWFSLGTHASGRDDASSARSESDESDQEGGHDNPGWSSFKSALVLLACTVLYSIIAEVLIDSIDFVLETFPMDEKTLGLTIFAIVPTITEFYNAIAFAVNGNIVLSLEIGSAYAIQVALLQIPALVAFSAVWECGHGEGVESQNFTLVFPNWDFYSVMFAMFLLTYIYIEGKSNYFKGAILLLSYSMLMAAFFFVPKGMDGLLFGI